MWALEWFSTLRHNRGLGEDGLTFNCVAKNHIRAGETTLRIRR
jgi:hypothetical protein